jgi:transposase
MELFWSIWSEEKLLMCPAFRESATVEAWFKEHPEVDIVSRDRGKEFAKAATLGAPQARQVVDRFHMVKNFSEVLREILGHCRTEIRKARSPSASVGAGRRRAHSPASHGSHLAAAYACSGEESPSGTSSQS